MSSCQRQHVLAACGIENSWAALVPIVPFALKPRFAGICRDRPQILDYVKLKVEVAELEKKLEDQSRRNEIAEMDLQRTKKMFQQLNTLPLPLASSAGHADLHSL